MGTVRMLLLSHDRSRNNTFGILIFFSFYSLVISMNMDMEGVKDEDIFNARPQRFTFGLGKRGSPTAAIKDKRLHELLVRINKWGFSGPHGLFKRSKMEFENQPQKRTFWEHLLKGIDEPIFKRGAYSFGLGKRNGQYSFGLGKRGKPAIDMKI